MPLWKKKTTNSGEKEPLPAGNVKPGATYPTQQQASNMYSQGAQGGPRSDLPAQPPPYSSVVGSQPQNSYGAGPAPPPNHGYGQYPPPSNPNMPPPLPPGQAPQHPPPQIYTWPPQPPPNPYPQSTVVVQGGYDAGARFDGIAQPVVPPPPPGCPPNAAQLAAAQGKNVVVTQKPGSFWEGGSDGGYVIF